jgi:hypothetical protein
MGYFVEADSPLDAVFSSTCIASEKQTLPFDFRIDKYMLKIPM